MIDDLVRNNADDLLRDFRRRLMNDSDAAEPLSEVLFTAWKLRRRVPAEPTQGRMWSFATAHNIRRSFRRTSARRSAAVERLLNEMQLMSAPTRDETAIEVRDAISRLPEKDAELVRLIYGDGPEPAAN